jgi:hypothetical protein
LHTSNRCRLERAPRRWLGPLVVILALCAAVAVSLSALPNWLGVVLWVVAGAASLPGLRRQMAIETLICVAPDGLLLCRRGVEEQVALQQWRLLGPLLWIACRGGSVPALPVWLPATPIAERQAFMRALAALRRQDPPSV